MAKRPSGVLIRLPDKRWKGGEEKRKVVRVEVAKVVRVVIVTLIVRVVIVTLIVRVVTVKVGVIKKGDKKEGSEGWIKI